MDLFGILTRSFLWIWTQYQPFDGSDGGGGEVVFVCVCVIGGRVSHKMGNGPESKLSEGSVTESVWIALQYNLRSLSQ